MWRLDKKKKGGVVDLGSIKGYFHVGIHIQVQILKYIIITQHKINQT